MAELMFESYYGIAGLGEPYLEHYGILGMKWGVRRYQNKDGTLTEAGKRRYGTGVTRSGAGTNFKLSDRQKRALRIGAGVAGAAAIGYAAYKLGGAKAVNRADASAISDMVGAVRKRRLLSDEELLRRIARLENQKKLRELTRAELDAGRSEATEILVSAGKKTAATVISGAMLYSIKSILTNEVNPRDAANYVTPRPKTK